MHENKQSQCAVVNYGLKCVFSVLAWNVCSSRSGPAAADMMARHSQGSYRSSKRKFPDFPWLFQSITQHFPDLYWHKFQYWNSI